MRITDSTPSRIISSAAAVSANSRYRPQPRAGFGAFKGAGNGRRGRTFGYRNFYSRM
jgi:hypothetical protein